MIGIVIADNLSENRRIYVYNSSIKFVINQASLFSARRTVIRYESYEKGKKWSILL